MSCFLKLQVNFSRWEPPTSLHGCNSESTNPTDQLAS
uniref:Uncharacterized protein n=1 Tax=Anguilla anguilla TaxID=7936 RepID=A0A0E9VX78_ANGAN